MLRVTPVQMRALEVTARSRFEGEMVSHIRAFAPRRCGQLENGTLLFAAQNSIDRAITYGFTKKGPIRLFVESVLLFGNHFDTDPQYPAFSSQLGARGSQMLRAECLHNEIVAYQAAVQGEHGRNLRDGLVA